MMTWLMLWAVMSAAFLQDAPPPRLVERGDLSIVDDARQAVARTAEEWEALWRRHAPDRPPPPVDFSREMVVGVFLGSRPTAGYSVDVLSAADMDGTMTVRYRVAQPARDAITAQIITSPYYIGAVPQHPGAVRFELVQP
jgi:hypothetical protein